MLDNTRHIPDESPLLVSLIPSARTLSYRNDPGGYSNIPLYEPTLLKKWLVVGRLIPKTNSPIFPTAAGRQKCGVWSRPADSLQLAPPMPTRPNAAPEAGLRLPPRM